jgi:hypothetical protein
MLAEHKPIDPDAAMLLSEAANHLNMTTAETLYEASSMLTPALNEYAEMLFQAATELAPALNNHAETISNAAYTFPDLLQQLVERISELRGLLGDI